MRMNRATFHQNSFAKALKALRQASGLSQEAFSLASSRTYISSLERGLKTPTLNKIDELAEVLDVHPLTLLMLAYMSDPSSGSPEELFSAVVTDISRIRQK